MICSALRREVNGIPEWLVANGVNMGRWTRIFGVNCLADTHDCKSFVGNMYIAHSGTELHAFEITEIT